MTDYEKNIIHDYKRNSTAVFLFELFWGFGMPFTTFITMAPAYLYSLGASKTLIGLVQALFTLTAPLQLLSIGIIRGQQRKSTLFFIFFVAIAAWFLYAVAAFLLIAPTATVLLTYVFVSVLFIFSGLLNIGNPIYFSILTDIVPREKRGKLFGLRTLGMGISGAIISFAVYTLLTRHSPPTNYQISFIIGTGLWLPRR